MPYLSKEVKDLHSQSLTQRQIAVRLECGLNTVRRRMKEQHLEGKSKGSRDFQINSDVFAKIDTEEKAYWLGFFLADACIGESAGTRRSFRLSLKKQDDGHIWKAAKFLGFRGKLHADNRGGHPRMVMVFNDVRFCKILMEHGWWDYKRGVSFEILDIIPDGLRRHYVRGYFDGDGCLSYSRRKRPDGKKRKNKDWYFNIVCKYNYPLVIYDKWISPAAGVTKMPKERKTVFSLVYNGNNRVNDVLDWLYKDATIYLDRKLARRLEFNGKLPFQFNNITNFSFSMRTDELISRKDNKEIVDAFTVEVLSSIWRAPKYNIKDDLEKCRNIDTNKYAVDDGVKVGLAPGNKIISNFQPAIYHVRQGKSPALSEFANNEKFVRRAVRAFCNTPDRALTSSRLIRELRFSGFSMASLLSVPVICAVVNKLGLTGKWFDPCAGWGNRLLAAHIRGLEYSCTDPGVCYDGLLGLKKWLGFSCDVQNKKWQDADWAPCNFIFTSPPFWSKEDYLDGVDYGSYDEWVGSFLMPLVNKARSHAKISVFHVDSRMRDSIGGDLSIPLFTGNCHKAPKEWFVTIK